MTFDIFFEKGKYRFEETIFETYIMFYGHFYPFNGFCYLILFSGKTRVRSPTGYECFLFF